MKYYGRYYSSYESETEFPWWFCLSDESVVSLDSLRQVYGYRNDDEIFLSGIFIPFFKTDISELEKEFLRKRNLKGVLDKLGRGVDFDILFRKYVDKELLFDDWLEYEGKQLRNDAIAWCRQYGIKYTEDAHDLKPFTRPK